MKAPLASRYASDEMLYICSPGQEVLHLAAALDRPGPGGDGAGPDQ